jgi:hypothetical protein
MYHFNKVKETDLPKVSNEPTDINNLIVEAERIQAMRGVTSPISEYCG